MRCPACRAPAIEIDTACRQCGFSLEAADRAFGIPPALERPVTDPQQVLGMLAKRGVQSAVAKMERRFPQVRLAVVLAEAPAEAPLAAHAFWLFNRGQLSSAMESGGENRLVLLLIDTRTRQAAAMIGYGLEPLVRETQLHTCLQAASMALERGRFGQGIEAFLRELDRQLVEVCRLVPQQFGLSDESQWVDASAPGDELVDISGPLY